MSIDEIIAACHAADGEGAPATEPEVEAEAAPAQKPAPAKSDPPQKLDPAKMSVEEMLAAARGGGGEAESSAAAEEEVAAEEEESAEATPSAPAAKLDRGKMSVEEMLAAARGQGQAPLAKEAGKRAKKPAAKKAAKPAAKGKSEPSGPLDTASVLAAARKGAKRGPISKTEAAEQEKASGKKTKPSAPPMPEKPAYARAAPPAESDSEDRRGFIASIMGAFLGSSLAIGFSSLTVTNILWTLGLARFMFPNILTEPPTVFKVGFPDEYAPGQVQSKYKAQFGVWIVRDEYEGEAQIFALKSVCTHLGCTPNWLESEQKFKCPCHGSGFYKDGVNFEGPAPRPLERYVIRFAADGQLEVDKSRKFNEELGQWKDEACFVPVS
jgi:cytochrome b6-f complex iron-sulfur subunit